MNVKDLKNAIENLPDDMDVIIQKDSEGNGFSPLEGWTTDVAYYPKSTWSGEIGEVDDSNEDQRCFLLWPVN